MNPDDTIVAISSPPGRGAIGLIRLSGPEALSHARSLFTLRANTQIVSGRVFLGTIRTRQEGLPIDEGYLTYHREGRSYTGQDIVEISCHGSPVVMEQILAELIGLGARPARAGEFTYRAVLHGRMDLTQAEGVRDLIAAPSLRAARVAHSQLTGTLSARVGDLAQALVETISRAEAALEFAEEPDVSSRQSDLLGQVERLSESMGDLLKTYREGRLLMRGARVVLAGRPNSGKSSLFNRLLDDDRAIVSPQPGTTRDYLTETIELAGIPVTLVDTAGLRDKAEGIEGEGVVRARAMGRDADLVLVLCEIDREPDEADRQMADSAGGRFLFVASKADLALSSPPSWTERDDAIPVSSVTGQGIDLLKRQILARLNCSGESSRETVLITSARQHEALISSHDALSRGMGTIRDGASEEVVLVDLYAALNHLEAITGGIGMDEIYERIFSTFCIGK